MDDLQKRQEELGIAVLKNCRNELYLRFPYLDGAFAGVDYRVQTDFEGIGTDGEFLYFHPEYLLKRYQEAPSRIVKGYLHMLLHCLYLHILPEPGLQQKRWNLACDMAVELIIMEDIWWREKPQQQIIAECIGKLQQEFGKKSFSAEELYVLLGQKFFAYPIEVLEEAFFFDDQRFWPILDASGREGLKKKWEKLRGLTGEHKFGISHTLGTEAGTGKEEAGEIQKSRYDYRKFLKQFAVLREEVELDMESFDYIYYSYGMKHYKNMPLIEHLEYKEEHKLEELVIAIDTSGSCSAEMVRRFLQESYGILGEKENFFRHMKVYFIQCDCVIQDVVCVHSEEEWKQYCKKLEIQGRAGTDFRPVFRYVEKLRRERELKDLKGLIYFTDGDGIYPREAPEYETAFVFVKKTEGMKFVPKWARCLVAE